MATTALRHAALQAQRAELPADLRDSTMAQRMACAAWLAVQTACPVCGATTETDEPCCRAQDMWTAYRSARKTSV